MQAIIVSFLSWYLVVQLISVAALPLSSRIFAALPDRGYAFAKSLGILLVGFFLWLGTSYGFLRNETGGAWLALLLVAGISLITGRARARTEAEGEVVEHPWWRRLLHLPLPGWRYILGVELLFLVAFLAWTWVRAHDPAINHTEQPMDLMFMSGIWTSPTFPPRDPWFAGYAISYYYFGYWLLTTVARLASQPPEIAYNLGQACWFGLLLLGSFGVGYNLMAASRSLFAFGDQSDEVDSDHARRNTQHTTRNMQHAIPAGLLTALSIGLTGNLHVILEWLHAQGVNVTGLANWAQVPNFPRNAQVTNQWFIDAGWSWWWRTSRVIGDTDLMGNHIEVIDEFPIFSYVLGDNHPHVLAMPFVLLVVGMALAIFVDARRRGCAEARRRGGDEAKKVVDEREEQQENEQEGKREQEGEREREPGREGVVVSFIAPSPQGLVASSPLRSHLALAWHALTDALPLGIGGLLLLVVATGALVFLNTWDFPPYWALLSLVTLYTVARRRGLATAVWSAVLLALLILAGTLMIYFPYFLTAQSQAGGVLPNFFNPTRLPQFLLMFGHFLLGVMALIILAWQEKAPRGRELLAVMLLVLGLPILFLAGTFLLANTSEAGRLVLQRMALPPEMSSYAEAVLDRWLTRPFTFLLSGGMAAAVIALLWRRLMEAEATVDPGTTFALLLAGIGLLLVFAPEFIYLRDNFGTRMNTVFKFYYQGWLLLAAASSYAIVTAFGRLRLPRPGSLGSIATVLLSSIALLLILSGLIYPVAGAYAKVRGFGVSEPTLNGIAYFSRDEAAAVEWVRRNTEPDAIVLQGKGRSYSAADNRINTATGRATLLGWDGHQSQWRGRAYAEMAMGRPEMLEAIYRSASPQVVHMLLHDAGIDYVFVGPVEQDQYAISPTAEARLGQVMDLVFEQGNVRIYRRRG
jgi:uncharacterized membrane protein